MSYTENLTKDATLIRGNEIMTIEGVECYEKEGTAYLKLETVARGLGFTETKNEKEYVMWRRVDWYLEELGFGTSAERPEFIPENIFYRLAMKAKNEVAERFQAKVADEIIPSIRRHGMYATDAVIDNILNDPDFGIRLLTKLKEERNARKEAEKKVENLENENDLLAQKILEWTDRPLINALVRAYAHSIRDDFRAAWTDFKKELLYRHSINLNSRITAYLNQTGKKTKPKTLDMLDESELPQALSTAVALCRNNGVDISEIIEKKAS